MSLISDAGSLSQQKTSPFPTPVTSLLHSSYLDSTLCCKLSPSLPGGHSGPPPGVPCRLPSFLQIELPTVNPQLLCWFAGVVGGLLIANWFSEVVRHI